MPIISPKYSYKGKCRCKKKTYKIKKIGGQKKTLKVKSIKRKKYSKESRRNVTILRNTTPKELKTLRKTIIKQGKSNIPRAPYSFSPTVNQLIDSLKSISPHREMGLKLCKEDHIYIAYKKGRNRCVGLKSKIAQTYMIDNLLSKKPIDCTTIIAPKQYLSNCWFNSFFMIFFISDKGRKFFRYLRLAMITGKLPNGTPIDSKLRMPFLLLNKYIEASLIGERRLEEQIGVRVADVMDTNKVIRKIKHAIGSRSKETLDIVKTREAGDPFAYYSGIINYLKSDALSFYRITVRNDTSKKWLMQKLNTNEHVSPDFFVLERWSEDYPPNSYKIHQQYKVTFNDQHYTYKLDSAILRDTKAEHFSTYITCNGKPFAFDGESFSRMTSFDWKKKLNKNTQWRFAEQHETYFNFQQGFYMLFYYKN